MKWDNANISKIIQSFAIASGHKIVNITQHLDNSILPNASKDLSLWMDTINNHPGGWYHRVNHGHDFVLNIEDVYHNFGADGVVKYPYELLKDFTTPHGIPVPGTQFLVNQKVIGAKAATEWLSCNIGDLFTGSIALYSTYKLYKKSKNGKLKDNEIIWASVGIGIKIVSGVISTNPILVISGVADLAILITNTEDAKKAFKDFFDWEMVVNTGIISAVAITAGVASASTVTTLVTTFGVASTGTAISTLSGAAATNATFALIGSGMGVAGGLAIWATGAGIIGLGAAAITYKYLKKKKRKAA